MPESSKREYLQRDELGRLIRILALDDEGIEYRSQALVPWADLVAFRAFPDLFLDKTHAGLGVPFPRVVLYLASGRALFVRGSGLRTRDSAHEIRPFERVPPEFKDLVDDLDRRGIPRWSGPREETVILGTGAAFLAAATAGGFGALAFLQAIESYSEVVLVGGILAGMCGIGVGFGLACLARRRYLRRCYPNPPGLTVRSATFDILE
ncbi:MAG TPA: hypothetical protein PLS53_11730 [Thermoanaerobaculaceae bacterium]|nr:hypothetical protein [Thermoanaerobaculaceae bacterium]